MKFFLTKDPNLPEYYYPVLLLFIIILIIINAIIYLIKIKATDLNISANHTILPDLSYPSSFIKRKTTLKIRYLLCYVLTKAAIWAKTPYLFTLYISYHGFTIKQIGFLYILDGVTALIAGPFIGNLSDVYGRKMFSLLICVFNVTNLCLRLTLNQNLAYVAQVMTGIGACLVNTTMESWVNFEANKDFAGYQIEKERFLKKLFKYQISYDAITSLATSFIAAVLYNMLGIFAPLILSICFSITAFVFIYILWDENKPNSDPTKITSFRDAWAEIKKREVLSIGLIESFFQGMLTLFVFAWTPLLQATVNGPINIGLISICFVIMLITGTCLYDIMIVKFKMNYYLGLVLVLFTDVVFFLVIYFSNTFMVRLIMLSFVEVYFILYRVLLDFICH